MSPWRALDRLGARRGLWTFLGLCAVAAAVLATAQFVGFRNDAARLAGAQLQVCQAGGPAAEQLAAVDPTVCPLASQVKAATDQQVTVTATGPAGAAGSPGPAGDPGAAGATGVAGPSGAPGVSGTPGAAIVGPSGAAGPTGVPGAAGKDGITVVGPAGADGRDGQDGAPGATGPRGEQGIPGPNCPDGTALAPVTFASGEQGLGCVSS